MEQHGEQLTRLEESLSTLLPNEDADWKSIAEFSRLSRRRICMDINHYQMPRQPARQSLQDALGESRTVVLLGSSGAGKSALVRRHTQMLEDAGGLTLWIGGSWLERLDLSALQRDIGIRQPLASVLKAHPGPVTVVIDGVARFHGNEIIAMIADLRDMLTPEQPQLACQFIITCQTSDWEGVSAKLRQARVEISGWKIIECPTPDQTELDELLKVIPAVEHIIHDPRLTSICQNLKILDLIARNSENGNPVVCDALLGESQVAAWFWDTEITYGQRAQGRGRLLMNLATKMADSLCTAVSVTDDVLNDAASLDEVVNHQLLAVENNRSVVFAHDLFGDWARLAMLKSQGRELIAFLTPRLSSPLWHRAVRLLGCDLLESSDTHSEWQKLLRQLKETAGESAADLLLESLFFSSNAAANLKVVAELLLNGEDPLLERLLARFLAFATQPDPMIVAAGRRMNLDDHQVAARFRLPVPLWWPPVLSFLYEYAERVVPLAPSQITRITRMWQQFTQHDGMLRQEISELALRLGCYAIEQRRLTSSDKRAMFTVALAAAAELPDKTAQLALFLAERTTALRYDRQYTVQLPFSDEAMELTALEDGPCNPVDDDFRYVVMDGVALLPLIVSRPVIAREVVLACLYVSEQEKLQRNGRNEEWRYDLIHDYQNTSPYWGNGPFRFFLEINFEEGLVLISRLVNTLAHRWCIRRAAEDSADIDSALFGLNTSLQLDAELFGVSKTLWGNGRILGWSARLGSPLPECVMTTALMALEKFLYDKMANDGDVEPFLRAVWQSAESVPFLQLFIDVGKKHPALFTDALMPLLTLPELFNWTLRTELRGRAHLDFPSIYMNAGQIKNQRDFNHLPHRNVKLQHPLALSLYLENQKVRACLDGKTAQWQKKVENMPEGEEREMYTDLIDCFTAAHYQKEKGDDGQVYWKRVATQKQREMPAQYRSIQRFGELTRFTFQCQTLRKNIKNLTESDILVIAGHLKSFIEPLWREDMASEYHAETADFAEITASAAALAGGIDVILSYYDEHSEPDASLLIWCRNTLLDLVRSPPPDSEIDTHTSVSDWCWDVSAAKAAMALWQADQDDTELRFLVARATFSFHNEAVKQLSEAATRLGPAFYPDILRLRRLVFEAAWFRARNKRRKWIQYLPAAPDKTFFTGEDDKVNLWFRAILSAFIEGNLEYPTADWQGMDTSAYLAVYDDDFNQLGYNLAPDFELIWDAHKTTCSLDETLSPDERHYRINFLFNALKSRVEVINSLPEKPASDAALLQSAEIDLINQIASACLQLKPDEQPDHCWALLLSLPLSCASWCEYFLSGLYRHGLTDKISRGKLGPLIGRYNNMVAALPEDKKWRNHHDIWQSLSGIKGSLLHCWTRDCADIAPLVWNNVRRYCEDEKADVQYLTAVTGWLETPAADALRIEGLHLLLKLPEAADATWHGQDKEDAKDRLAELLQQIWRTSEDDICSNVRYKTDFMSLLQWLADHQHPIGLELTGNIGNL
ncbi:hypothetical protein [Pantoea sp. App145]|uniref:hypothetical protein n=1 Tax=Pantoea sp. App145 TaxID=3071567 RepID=UPI003A80C201